MNPGFKLRHIVPQHLCLLEMPSITGVEPQAVMPVDCLQRLMDEHIPRLTDRRVELTLGHSDQDGLYQSAAGNARWKKSQRPA